MTELSRVRSIWTGFPGAPGVTTMWFLDTATAVASVHAFWTTLAGMLPEDVDIMVEHAGDIVEDTTGVLTGAWSAEPVTSVAGSASGAYAAPAGAVIDWLTETILDGRRLRGRTFVVPCSGDSYEADGSLKADHIGYLQAAADGLVAEQSLSFVVYHRKSGSHAGGNGLITSTKIPDMVAILRSRRD